MQHILLLVLLSHFLCLGCSVNIPYNESSTRLQEQVTLPENEDGFWLTGLSTKFSDSFIDWDIYLFNPAISEDEQILGGEMSLLWVRQSDWSEWNYRIGDTSGVIKMKWNDNPNQWELRSNNEVVTINTIYKDDPTTWRITDNTRAYTLVSRWSNLPYEWSLRERNHGNFKVSMISPPDPRDWDIFDELDNTVSLEIKMAMIFIAVYHSTPKW